MAKTEVRGTQIQQSDLTDVVGTLAVANGGTGGTTQALNNVLLGNGTGSFQNVAPGNAGNVLRSDGSTWSSQPRVLEGTVASSATPSINVDNIDFFTITALAVAITSMTSGLTGTPVDGQRLLIRIKDNGTARAITWGASFISSGVATLLATTVAGKTHLIGFIYDADAAKWVCVAVDAVGY